MALDLSILLLFIAYSTATGFFNRAKASENIEEFFLAGRTLSGWQAGLSMSATQYAADTPLLVAGLVATGGIFSLWQLWIYAIAFLFMGFGLGACWRRANVLTDAELTELRYGGKLALVLRVLKAIHLGTVINCTVLAMVLLAAARIAEPFFPWHEWLPKSVFEPVRSAVEHLGFHLTTLPSGHPDEWSRSGSNFLSLSGVVFMVWLYSVTGGLRSVVMTDVGQFMLMMIGTACYAIAVLLEVGGFYGLFARLEQIYGAASVERLLSFGPPDFSEATIAFLTVIAIQWFAQVSADGTGYLAQRTMGCRSDRDARLAAVIFAFAQVLLRTLLWLPIVLGLLVIYPAPALFPVAPELEGFRVEREMFFITGIQDLLPLGVRGVMLTAMVAALASTVDTHLNWGASYWTNDIYKRLITERVFKRTASARELVIVARFSNVLILVIAFLIALNLNSIQAAWRTTLLFGSGLGVVLLLRWVWYRCNRYSELAALVISGITAPVLLRFGGQLSDSMRLLCNVTLTTAGVLIVTLLTPPESEDTLQAFYRRVRPIGWWGPIAAILEEKGATPINRLRSAFCLTLLTVSTLFSLLLGVGGALFGGVGNLLTCTLLIFIGLGLIPFWWRGIDQDTT